jgi:hypothetical protein
MATRLGGSYLHLLSATHVNLRPRTYVEIGLGFGDSFCLVRDKTTAVGVDPAPRLHRKPPRQARIFTQTSDEFFAEHDLGAVLDGPVDLAFVDGMHHFEVALRDFRNLERHAGPRSVILVHDCYPPSAEWASRDPRPDGWAGDVWKLVWCLAEYRPDLRVAVAAANPSGLGVITGLDPHNDVLFERYDEIVDRAAGLSLAEYAPANVVPGRWTPAAHLFPGPFRRRGPLQAAVFQTKRVLRHTPVASLARARRQRHV